MLIGPCDPDVLWGLTAEEDVSRLEGMPLWHLSVEDGCRVRWAQGRRERGLAEDAPFQGDALEEALPEGLDLVTYLRQAGLHKLAAEARDLSERIRQLLLAREDEDTRRSGSRR